MLISFLVMVWVCDVINGLFFLSCFCIDFVLVKVK